MEETMDGLSASTRLTKAALALGVAALAATMLLGAARGAAAQDATPTPERPVATVSVNGRGAVTIAPDTASVVIGVTIIEPTLSAAQEKATTQMTAVIEALKAAGIEDRDIQTVSYSVNIIQDYDERGYPAKFRGFQVANQVNVTVRDLTQLGSILDTVVAAGANTIYGINFFVDDPSEAASRARALAVQDARTKAEELAAAAGVTVGRLLSISETYAPPPAPVSYADMVAEQRAAVPIEVGTQVVTVDVQVSWELE
jgi:uncharacterized protein YggE